jgi:sugar phosphate permease
MEQTASPTTVSPPLSLLGSYVRVGILTLIPLLYLIIYLEKSNIAVAAPAISRAFGFDRAQMGWIFSAFVLAYAIGQIPSGWLADRLGPRRVISLLVPFWSVTTLLTGLGGGFVSLLGLRFLTGLGASGTFPITTRAMQPWFYPSERGTIHGISHACARLGGAIVPPLAVWLMVSFGWRWVFYVCGAIGFLWVGIFLYVYRDTPAQHPRLSAQERARLSGLRTPSKCASVPWAVILRSPNMVFIACAFGCYAYGGYFFIAWLPSYLVDYRHLSMTQMGLAASLPLLAGMVGDLIGGLAGDYMLRRTGRLNLSRRIVAVVGMLGAALFIIPAAMADSAAMAVIYLSVSLLFMEFLNGPSWAVTMDVGGRFSGTVSSLMNMGASIAGSISPVVFGMLTQQGRWLAPFVIQAAVLVLGAVIWLFLIDAERPIIADASMLENRA